MKNIVITGGTSGVGLAIARDLAASGHRLIIVGRNLIRGESVANTLGNNTDFVAGDLTTDEGRRKVVNFIKKSMPMIDVLFFSAGIYPKSSTENIQANLTSHYYLTKSLEDRLAGGRILIVTGSPTAIQWLPINSGQQTVLQRSAWILTHKTLLMTYLSHQLHSKRISVNSFFPGDVNSRLMPYTMGLSNQKVPVGKILALSPSFDGVTGRFFDENGQEILLNQSKYNYNQAQIILSKYFQ